MKRTLYLAIMLLFTVGIHSCEKYVFGPSTFQEVSLSEDIQPVFNAKCTSCHSASGSLKKKPFLSSDVVYNELVNGGFVDTDNPEESKIYLKLQEGHQNAIPDDAEMVKVWIEEGAKDN